jgi:N-acetylmuramoyl-L-alanine amidase
MTSAKPSTPQKSFFMRRRSQGSGFSTWSGLQSILSIAVLMATLFTVFMPSNLFSNKSLDELMTAAEPDSLPTQPVVPTSTSSGAPRIGIISGHKGIYDDPGAVCAPGFLPNGLTTEAEVNERIATLVVQKLSNMGYQVDMLDEFDPRLDHYRALALVSIHNDSCEYINNEATGFKASAAMMNTTVPDLSERLASCLVQRYASLTGLKFHFNSITEDMTYYHVFNEIGDDTPAAIIETGFLNIDGNRLVTDTDIIAQGVVNGILCYVNNEPVQPDPTPTPAGP